MPSVLDSSDPDHSVGPDLGPNCLQRSSADNNRRQRILILGFFIWTDPAKVKRIKELLKQSRIQRIAVVDLNFHFNNADKDLNSLNQLTLISLYYIGFHSTFQMWMRQIC